MVRRPRFEGQVVVITGAGSGIGEAMAVAFASEGATVVVVDRDDASASRVAGEIVASGGAAHAESADVSLANDVRRVIDGTVARYGKLDVLCNNAGIGVAATCHETSEADWDLTMAIDLKGVFLGCKYAIPHMISQGRGVICNTSSVAGQVGVLNRAAYCSAKAGVLGLTKSSRSTTPRTTFAAMRCCRERWIRHGSGRSSLSKLTPSVSAPEWRLDSRLDAWADPRRLPPQRYTCAPTRDRTRPVLVS